MSASWPDLSYEHWSATCDTLHAHTQVLGKLAVVARTARAAIAARGAETDRPRLGNRAAASAGRLWPYRRAARPSPPRGRCRAQQWPGGAHRACAGPGRRRGNAGPARRRGQAGRIRQDRPDAAGSALERVRWTPTTSMRAYDRQQVEAYFAAAGRAAMVLAAFRAPYRGRSTPVNAWWGSFDLAVSLFSGRPADPPADDFIMRNAMDAQEVAVGWWPGDPRHPAAAFYAYAHPAPEGFDSAVLEPAGAAGTRPSASTCSTGRTCALAQIRTPPRWSSPGLRSGTHVQSATGTRGWPRPRDSLPPPVV